MEEEDFLLETIIWSFVVKGCSNNSVVIEILRKSVDINLIYIHVYITCPLCMSYIVVNIIIRI